MHSELQKRCNQAFRLGLDDFPLYSFQSQREALEGLRSGLEQGQRLLCLTGPSGSGKSAVLSALHASLTSGYIGLLTQPGLGDVLSRLNGCLQLSTESNEPISEPHLMTSFARAQMLNAPIIQLVDDAEKLEQQDLVRLNRLFHRFGGQLILCGTPALLSLFQDDAGTPDPVHPDQVFQLKPLNEMETGEYIQHRLRQAYFDPELFSIDAVTAVTGYSGGLPQLVNVICFMALVESCVTGTQPITADAINAIARQRWESGIYPFHALPPTAATDTVPEEDSQIPEPGTRIDAAFHRSSPVPEPLSDDSLFDRDGTSWVPPTMRADTGETIGTEIAGENSIPEFSISDKPGIQVSPALYGEHRKPSPAAHAYKASNNKRWLLAGLASIAAVGLGIMMYSNTGLFERGFERMSNTATERFNQLINLAGDDHGSASTTSREIMAWLQSYTGRPEEKPAASSLNRQADAADEHNGASPLSTHADTAPSATAVTDAANTSMNSPEPAADPASEFSSFDHQAALPASSEKPASIVGPATPAYTENHPLAHTPSAASRAGTNNPVQPTADHPTRNTTTDLLPTTTPPLPTKQAGEPPFTQQETNESRQASPPLTPAQQSRIATLYLERAEYEYRNSRYRDALISIGYGLDAMPNHPSLTQLRSLVLKELNEQPR